MRALRRSIAAFLLVWFLPACATYQTTDLAPQEEHVDHCTQAESFGGNAPSSTLIGLPVGGLEWKGD
jgi:hypothetical protein